MDRRVIAVLAALSVVAMTWAGVAQRDSFPLSNYPMFAGDRPSVASFDTVVTVEPDGTRRRLSPQQIGGTDQVIQAAATVSAAIRRADADQLCAEILERVRADALEVVTERYDTRSWFDGNETPETRVVHAECAR